MQSQDGYPSLKLTKGALANHYYQISTALFRSILNRIISEARNIGIEEAKRAKRLTPKEFRLFVDEIEGK